MSRAELSAVIASVAMTVVLSAGTSAASCHVDADCSDGTDCNGIETCGYDGECRPGVGLCGPPVSLPGTRASASSEYDGGYSPGNLIDGVDQSDSSWCSARNDPAPSVTISWALDVEVHEIRALTSWSPSYDFLTGRFRLLDASGAIVFDSGIVTFTAGEATVPVAPPATGVRRMEIIGETWRSSDPCLSEVEIDGALPCASDADCAFFSPCLAVGVCLPSGTCSATAPRCRNLAPSYASLDASSVDVPYVVQNLVDGQDTPEDSWCAASSDPAPTLTLTLPNEHPIDIIRMTAPWSGYQFETGVFTIEDSLGVPVLDSGVVSFDHGAIDYIVEPRATAAHLIRLEAVTTVFEPCVGELQVLGEYCGIAVAQGDPLTIAFRPGTPTPEFEVFYGLLSELVSDGNFERAACLGRYAAESIAETLPDPPPGEGYYLIARGLNVCTAEGFGMSSATPDPRAALAASAACPP